MGLNIPHNTTLQLTETSVSIINVIIATVATASGSALSTSCWCEYPGFRVATLETIVQVCVTTEVQLDMSFKDSHM